jgi:hypothetical protein
MLSTWSQAKVQEVTFGTVRANEFDAEMDPSLVAQVIAVGYSSIKQEMAFARVTRFPFSQLSGPAWSRVTRQSVRVQCIKCAQGGRNHGDAED